MRLRTQQAVREVNAEVNSDSAILVTKMDK